MEIFKATKDDLAEILELQPKFFLYYTYKEQIPSINGIKSA
jgi:hypothetical protein